MKPTTVASLEDEIKIDKQVRYLSILTKALFLIAISLLVFLITSSTCSDSDKTFQEENFKKKQVSNTSPLNPPVPY
ncbi:hypothetical protein [Christiangramia sp. LLG6405-1]|uniref:hypothetical protein n=1 Tax=Christiangramia sp. LLG6405-1 TaxID=3160832 RepID=UPI003863E438